MMKKNKIVLSRMLVFFIAIVMIIDITYYLKFRLGPTYPRMLVSWSYESLEKSYIRWFLCLLAIIGLIRIKSALSMYLMTFSSIGIILLSLIKGRLYYILHGSFVFNICLFEVIAVLLMFFIYLNNEKTKTVYLVLFILATISLFLVMILNLPGVQPYPID